MSRSVVRVFAVAFFVLGLTVSLAPAAQARPPHASAQVADTGGSWLHAAATWLTRLIAGTLPDSPPTIGGGALPNIGSCIDPWGPHCL